MLWRNKPSIIVGRNQNTLAEINIDFVREHNLPVIRRLTGGGAVFHDLGNVNFTFIQHGYQKKGLDFHSFTKPILKALQALGVPCEFQGRNDLVIQGQKFSGNAQRVEKDRVLHHGTLLFAAEIPDLSQALRVNPVKYAHRAVSSVRQRVTNIASHLSQPMEVEDFIEQVMDHVSHGQGGVQEGLNKDELAGAKLLVHQRYGCWHWNFGSSPRYSFSRTMRTSGGVVEAHVQVNQGRITALRLHGDYFGLRPIAQLEAVLVGTLHTREALAQALQDLPVQEYIQGMDVHSLLDCLY